MINLKRLAGGVAFVAMSAALTPVAFAQVTTSGVQGSVSNADGSAAADATVTIEDTRTGLTRTVVSTPTGQFDVRGLNVGGPYTVTVTKSGEQSTQVTDIFLALGSPTALNLAFSGETASTDVIVITASQAGATPIATGPAATFGLAELESLPLANRDIRDIVRYDPRISIDEGNSDAISCGGANPRFNALTLDGVRLSDSFGLNSSGYPTERMPFSIDAIEQVSVELAPFDVQYGFFTACNINAVTKSGTNEFHGGAFFDYTDVDLTGDETDGIKRNLGDFDEKRYGFTLGGPIIADTLFFFGAYEKFEGANIFGYLPQDKGIDPAVYQQVIDIAEGYGYVSGGLPSSMAVEDEKILAKLDWNINDRHRASFTYNYNDGFNFSSSDDNSTQIVDGNHYYERGAELTSYTGQLYSDWADNFSTELSISKLELANRQNSVAGPEFGEIQVIVPRITSGTATIYLGSDDSRHRNKLNYEVMRYKAAMNYSVDDHVFTAGVEREELEVFNLFLQEVEGEWRFSSPADFAAGRFNYFEYSNAVGSNDPNDAAAAFGYETTTLYLQDDWQVTDELNVVAGLRLDVYSSDDKPAYNQTFRNLYGFRNDETFDGLHLLQPRLGFTYALNDSIELRGGAGLYSGGNPNVWLSNSYSNSGVLASDFICRSGANGCNFSGLTLATANTPNLSDFTYAGGTGTPFFDVPDEGIDFIANAAPRGQVNAIDPDFELPYSWRAALGMTWDLDTNTFLGNGYRLNADVLYAQTSNAVALLPLGYVRNGTFIDGRPRYTGNTTDFVLTNTPRKADAWTYSLSLSQAYDFGLDWTIGYAHIYANEAYPMGSSTAGSNFENAARYDILNMPLDRSDYVVPNRFTFVVNYELELLKDFPTKLSLAGFAQEGLPYSYTMDVIGSSRTFEPFGTSSTNSTSRMLAYIPTGLGDPNISPSSNAGALQALENYIASNDRLSDYRGTIAARNIANDDWVGRMDLRLSQAIPGFMADHKAEAYVVIQNLGNLINSDWGIVREHGYPAVAELYTVGGVDSQNRYIITGFQNNPDSDSITVDASLWQVRVGARYDF